MVREELQAASDELREAASTADGEIRDRIEGQADQLATLASAERGPDQGRLDRHMNILRELADDAGEGSDHVERALEHVEEYRKGVSGI
ncbi:hypothetical protein ACFQPA_12390 [Halomarina halobia]|uniref:Uncharacterized protein n=1 Tax=Halomarina halobia TaxID=3033386 RepID=A0ABD6A971_9EURY|nr:hypothetical protein [Halomarina sp. PSR21]